MPALRNFLVVPISLLLYQHANAAPDWVDGEPGQIDALCGADNSIRGVVTRAGYVVDPVAETPRLGEVVFVHGVATNTNCAADTVTIDFFLPTNASLAISPQDPVVCLLHDGIASAPIAGCLQQPTTGPRGGLSFLPSTFLPPVNSTRTWSVEIRVPVSFSQASVGAPVSVAAASPFWGDASASVAVTVPYQPPLPQSTRGDDLVLLGSALSDAGTLPVAFSNDTGSFTVTNYPVGDFAAWARTPNVTRLSGDFNRDGYTDYALVGGAGWRSIPVAMSQANGMFTITNNWVGEFGTWAATPNVKPIAGDFNRDGHTDIALVGGAGWQSIPVAFSARGGGNGYFEITNLLAPDFAIWAASPNVRPRAGDDNRDGKTDIALVGGTGWASLPVAYSFGNGTFQIFNPSANSIGFIGYYLYNWNFAAAAREPTAQVVTADFNKDGMTDIAVIGGTTSPGMRFAMSYGNGTWQIFERQDATWATWSRSPGVKPLVGDFNKDGWPDLALTGVAGWGSIPVATFTGNGYFTITNHAVPSFATWASTAGVRHVVGDFNGDGFSDIALTGAAGWGTIPVAFGYGSGIFGIVNLPTNRFPQWSSDTSATVLAGRVNH